LQIKKNISKLKKADLKKLIKKKQIKKSYLGIHYFLAVFTKVRFFVQNLARINYFSNDERHIILIPAILETLECSQISTFRCKMI